MYFFPSVRQSFQNYTQTAELKTLRLRSLPKTIAARINLGIRESNTVSIFRKNLIAFYYDKFNVDFL